MPRSKTARSTPKPSEPKLSDVARHIVMPEGIVTTAWPRVVAKCADMGVTFDSWQHGVGSIALGKRKDGKYAATVGGVVLSIPRQVGKTFLVGMIIIALCVLFPGFTVLWTAHRTRTATMTFESMQGMVKRKKIRPHLAPGRNDGIRTSNGQQEIRFKNGSVIMFGAREDGFGRGFDQVDIEVFDEAQILTEKALEDMVPAANQSQHPAGALLFFMGTPPRPVDRGDEFSNRRQKALSGKGKNSAYIEFSADDDADSDDKAQWAKANPSYPLRTPDESMERMREQLTDDDSFRREALGIWDPNTTPQVIDPKSWSDVKDAGSMGVERISIAFDVAPDRRVASASLAAKRADGLWHIELADQRTGVDWIPAWLTERAAKNKLHAVVADEMSGLIEKRKNGRWYVKGTDVLATPASAEGRDMAVACAAVFDGVMSKTLRHTDQPQMNVALSVARKRPLAGAWAWNRKDAVSDITPIVSASLALWGAQNENAKRQRRTEQREMVVI